MSVGHAFNRYLDALGYARVALAHPGVLAPFALFFGLQAGVLLLMAGLTAPLLAPVMVPVMKFLGGEQSLHYPMHLVGLPAVYQRVYLPLVATVGFALWSLAAWRLVDRHDVGSDRPRHEFRSHLGRVVVIGVLFVGASVVAGELAARLSGTRTPDGVRTAVLLVSIFVTVVVQALLIYAPLVLRVRGGSALGAVSRSASFARRQFPATVMVIATVLLIHLPVDFLLSRADRIAARFQPETVLHVMLGSAALEMFTAYLLFAAVTELALSRDGGLR